MHRRTTDCQNELVPAMLSGRQSRRLVPALGRRSPHPRPPGEPCPRPADQAEWQLATRAARRGRLRRQHWRHLRDLDEREVQEHRAPRGRRPQGGAALGGGVPLSKHARHDRATEGAYGACRRGRRCL